jgi:catechol-2,3-dioxygenase
MTDQRPPMWIGHTHLSTNNVAATKAFLLKLGMRDVFPESEEIAILEIRAGTHIIVEAATEAVQEDQTAGFDLMVEDIEAMHAELTHKGLSPNKLSPGSIHTTFTITEPGGVVLKYFSSHNSGEPV